MDRILGLWIVLSIITIIYMWVFTSDHTLNYIITTILGISIFVAVSILRNRYNKKVKNRIASIQASMEHPEALVPVKPGYSVEEPDAEPDNYYFLGYTIKSYPLSEQTRFATSLYKEHLHNAMEAVQEDDRKQHAIVAMNTYRLIRYIHHGIQTDEDYNLTKPISSEEQLELNNLWGAHPQTSKLSQKEASKYEAFLGSQTIHIDTNSNRVSREDIINLSMFIPLMCSIK